MATVNDRAMVDQIIAANGKPYEDEPAVVRIVQYNNDFNGALAYGLVYESEVKRMGEAWLHRYETSEACHNPIVIFRREPYADR